MRRPMFPAPALLVDISGATIGEAEARGCRTRRTMELLTARCDPTVTLRGALVRY